MYAVTESSVAHTLAHMGVGASAIAALDNPSWASKRASFFQAYAKALRKVLDEQRWREFVPMRCVSGCDSGDAELKALGSAGRFAAGLGLNFTTVVEVERLLHRPLPHEFAQALSDCLRSAVSSV